MIFLSAVYQERQHRLAKSWSTLLKPDDLVLVCSGEPVQKPGGLDQTYDFFPHPAYYWLTGHRRPRGIMAYSPTTGWTEYQRPLSPVDIVWEGSEGNFRCEHTLIELEEILKRSLHSRVIRLGSPDTSWGMNSDSDREFAWQLSLALDKTRRKKDEAEVQLIQKIAQMANAGYTRLQERLREGVTERELQLHYEHAVLLAGAEKMPYGSIVGSGENAAILHAVPTSKKIQKGELVLVDAGADIEDYCVDITRVFAVDGLWNSRQQVIYDLVLKAQTEAIAMCRPQIQWKDVHIKTARVIAEGLDQLGFWKSSVDAALESEAIAVFYPHGVGHLVGLKVRDTGCPEVTQAQRYCGARLRVDLPLEENFLVTVEPGCYFARAFIEDGGIRNKYKDIINWSVVDTWKDFGGVRLEDDILVTLEGPKNLTSCVKK